VEEILKVVILWLIRLLNKFRSVGFPTSTSRGIYFYSKKLWFLQYIVVRYSDDVQLGT